MWELPRGRDALTPLDVYPICYLGGHIIPDGSLLCTMFSFFHLQRHCFSQQNVHATVYSLMFNILCTQQLLSMSHALNQMLGSVT